MCDMTEHTAPVVLWPTLRYVDAPAAIAFLVEALGFREAAVFRDEAGDRIEHAELLWPGGGAGVMLSSAGGGGVTDELPPATGSVYIVTDDIDARFERARAAGATVVREPTDEDYGGRDFVVRDPEGVFWSFGTYAGSGTAAPA